MFCQTGDDCLLNLVEQALNRPMLKKATSKCQFRFDRPLFFSKQDSVWSVSEQYTGLMSNCTNLIAVNR